MQGFEKLFGTCYKMVCVAIISFMVLIVFVNTVLRYCFNSGLVVNEEVLRYLFIWATFLGIIAVYYEHRHIAVTLLTDRLSPKAATLFTLGANCLVLYAMYVLAHGSLMYMEASETTRGQMTDLPFVYIVAASLIASLACTGMVLIDMGKQARALWAGRGR
jgi:TRAP-type C4-dicarboxylate transport system permease small subunit